MAMPGSTDAGPSPGSTRRLADSPVRLVLDAIGPPLGVPGKRGRLARAIAAYRGGAEVDAKLAKLHRLGLIETIPNRPQLVAGAIDMLRFWITPAAAQYYEERGIDFGFHQVLRFLDEPASLVDPIGLFSTRDGIIGHLMQVVHAIPWNDLELLRMFDDGLDELESQLRDRLADTHPRAASIGTIVEEPDYHARLLEFVIAWRRDPTTAPLLRSNVREHEEWSDLERTFGSLTTSMRYFTRLPDTPAGAARHVLFTKRFPAHLAEPRGPAAGLA